MPKNRNPQNLRIQLPEYRNPPTKYEIYCIKI